MTESPSLLLQRAADVLEQAVTKVSAPQFWDREIRGADLSESGAAWAKLIGPPAAAPLVAWLRYAQARFAVAEGAVARGSSAVVYRNVSDSDRAALDFTRLVLGLSVEEETTQ